ncbi:NUDIX hydrolase domain-like protein, partial [Microdochium trichocladiopsis]
RVLLVQRAPHDSMPLRWEVPGGGCDEEDPSILYSCARELFEETGLKAVGVGPLVRGGLGGQFFRSRSGKLVCKFQFVVAVDLDAGLRVKLDPNEHFAYIWATEEEVRRKEV